MAEEVIASDYFNEWREQNKTGTILVTGCVCANGFKPVGGRLEVMELVVI